MQDFLDFMSDGKWHTAQEIREHTGLSRDDLRKMPVFSGGLIGSTTQGFKLTKYASLDEKEHAYNSLISRAREIRGRAEAIWAWRPHSLFSGVLPLQSSSSWVSPVSSSWPWS